jgi:hypothetical protein
MLDIITTVVTPAQAGATGAAYDLASLADIKTDLNINAGTAFTTSQDAASGTVLPFASTYGIAKGQNVVGLNIPPGATVQLVGPNTVTMSAAVLGDVPAGSSILFNVDATADAFLARRITLSSAAIQKYCNRQFPIETIQDQFNFLRGPYPWQIRQGLQVLQLSKLPLVSVSSVVVTQNEIATTYVQGVDFMVDLANSQLIRLSESTGLPIPWLPFQTTVVYQAGFATIPSDVDDACSRMVKRDWWARGRDPSVMEQATGQMGSTKFWVNPSPDGNLPAEIADLLDNYRFPVFA